AALLFPAARRCALCLALLRSEGVGFPRPLQERLAERGGSPGSRRGPPAVEYRQSAQSRSAAEPSHGARLFVPADQAARKMADRIPAMEAQRPRIETAGGLPVEEYFLWGRQGRAMRPHAGGRNDCVRRTPDQVEKVTHVPTPDVSAVRSCTSPRRPSFGPVGGSR